MDSTLIPSALTPTLSEVVTSIDEVIGCNSAG